MPRKASDLVSAQVILKSASGRAVGGKDVITAETLGEFLPSAETVQRVTEFFVAAGFEAGPVVGISFPITAPAALFERVLGVRPRRRTPAGKAARGATAVAVELPLDALPPAIREVVSAIALPPPPAFGPGNP